MKPDLNRYPPQLLEGARQAIAAAITKGGVNDHGADCSELPQFNLDEVATALAYLTAGPVKVLNKIPSSSGSSYGWKHDAEHWGELVGLSPYVSNGAFIVAADWLGIFSRRITGSPNVFYALRSLRDIQNEHVLHRALGRY